VCVPWCGHPDLNHHFVRVKLLNEIVAVRKILQCSSTTSQLEQSAVVKEAQIEALKSIAKNLLGIDLLDVKVARERELGKDLTPVEELEAYESEIRKLRIDPQKLRKQEAGEYQNKLVRERELERYLNKGWEMVQTVNSRILVRKPILTSKRS